MSCPRRNAQPFAYCKSSLRFQYKDLYKYLKFQMMVISHLRILQVIPSNLVEIVNTKSLHVCAPRRAPQVLSDHIRLEPF